MSPPLSEPSPLLKIGRAATIFAALCAPAGFESPARAEDGLSPLPVPTARNDETKPVLRREITHEYDALDLQLLTLPDLIDSAGQHVNPLKSGIESPPFVEVQEWGGVAPEPVPPKETVKTPVTPQEEPSAPPKTQVDGPSQKKIDGDKLTAEVWQWTQLAIGIVGGVVTLVGIPFVWLTWRKRADEVFERQKVNDGIRNRRLESDISHNTHRFKKVDGQWQMRILNVGESTTAEFFGGSRYKVFADVFEMASSLTTDENPFPIKHVGEVLSSPWQRWRAWVNRTALPDERLMVHNTRRLLRNWISARFNPERRVLDDGDHLEERRVFGILVRDRTPVASTLVNCIIQEKFLRKFGDESFVRDLLESCDQADRERVKERVEDLRQAYHDEKPFLDYLDRKKARCGLPVSGEQAPDFVKSQHPWAYVYFPVKGPAVSEGQEQGDGARKSSKRSGDDEPKAEKEVTWPKGASDADSNAAACSPNP